jgi:cation diffusion facilitator family transporter
MATSSRTVILAALAGNFLVAVTKFVAATLTGSSAMMSEGFHSLVDTSNEVLLLYGEHRAAKPPDELHPLGYGRELYFWSFVVAVMIFGLGAGLSIYEGAEHLRHPEPIADVLIAYVVLGLSFLFEGASWWIAFRAFRAASAELGLVEAARQSKDPPTFTVLFEDSAALAGLLIALAGTFLSSHFAMPVFDGIASIAIGLVLAAVAVFLARESKALLIGERADRATREAIVAVTTADPAVEAVNSLFTVHLGPQQVVAALSVDFRDGLSSEALEAAVERIERTIRRREPEVTALFVKPQARRQPAPAPAGSCRER